MTNDRSSLAVRGHVTNAISTPYTGIRCGLSGSQLRPDTEPFVTTRFSCLPTPLSHVAYHSIHQESGQGRGRRAALGTVWHFGCHGDAG
jgi:hypothetical protein